MKNSNDCIPTTLHKPMAPAPRASRLGGRSWLQALACAVAGLLASVAPPALAQDTSPQPAAGAANAPALVAARSPQVGDATRALLAHQANGVSASAVPRPIAGDVAQKSYERYLKSFDYPIPERFGTAVQGSPASGR